MFFFKTRKFVHNINKSHHWVKIHISRKYKDPSSLLAMVLKNCGKRERQETELIFLTGRFLARTAMARPRTAAPKKESYTLTKSGTSGFCRSIYQRSDLHNLFALMEKTGEVLKGHSPAGIRSRGG